MDVGEQHQLREWAYRLRAVEDPERRAMGRAIEMLLDRIGQLEHELQLARPPIPERVLSPEPGPLLDPVDPHNVGEDTQQLSLRDRLRLATDHFRDRGDHDR